MTIEAHQTLCRANGHQKTFPRVRGWSRDDRGSMQNYIHQSGWAVVTERKKPNLPLADGVKLEHINWTRDHISFDRMFDPMPECGELIQLDEHRSRLERIMARHKHQQASKTTITPSEGPKTRA